MIVTFTCPSCWQPTAAEVDAYGGSSVEQVEDCQVCCRPIRIRARFPAADELEFYGGSLVDGVELQVELEG